MSASIVSRVSVNTASAAVINDSADTSAFVADSSTSSIGVADARFAARRSSSTLARFNAFSASASARRIASRFVQKRVPVPSAQCRQSFCVAMTRGHHVRHLHQCPEVVSLSRQATWCQVPSKEELVLCIPQSANLCDITHPDTSCTQVFASRLPS